MTRFRLKHNKGLPPRWSKRRGKYYYSVPPGLEDQWDGYKLFPLGKSLSDAHKEYAKRAEISEDNKTIADMLDRYALEVVPTKALRTQKDNHRFISRLRAVFGHGTITSIRPKDAYQYIDKSNVKGQAKREIKLLSHAFTVAQRWGYIDFHPLKGQLRIEGEKSRTRYVEDWEIAEFLAIPAKSDEDSIIWLQAYIELKLLTGLRKSDLLRLRETDLTDKGIAVTTGKSGKKIVILWTDALRAAVEKAKAARPVDITPFLFCNKWGKSYYNEAKESNSGFDSIWQRTMKERVIGSTKVIERFTEHDIRAKASSDLPTVQAASELLTHSDTKVTDKHYRRKPQEVRPTK